jgi:hypothetical protein
MPSEKLSQPERDLHEVKGAMDVLFSLREEFAQWLEEAQDESKHEVLENVLAHIETLESEYRAREAELEKARGAR